MHQIEEQHIVFRTGTYHFTDDAERFNQRILTMSRGSRRDTSGKLSKSM
jgi:hypothetical protein